MPGERHRPGRVARGQTTIDFVVGIGLFLVTVGFIVGFVPGLMSPFVGGQEGPVVADRVASQLVNDLLGGPDEPGVLDAECTVAFFGHGDDDACPFDAAAPITERVGIASTQRVNVTLDEQTDEPGTAPLCADGGAIQPCSDSGDRLAAGPTPPESRTSVTVARRTASLDGRLVVVHITVW